MRIPDRAELLHERCEARGYRPRRVAEVGVFSWTRSQCAPFVRGGAHALLIEANPLCAGDLRVAFGDFPERVEILELAVADASGRGRFLMQGESSYLDHPLLAPGVSEAHYRREEQAPSVEVAAVRFDEIDPGDLDLLCVDIEGADWFVLKYLQSRPAVIAIETHGFAGDNPYRRAIGTWARVNGYRVWYKTRFDTVYVLPAVISVTLRDRLRLWITELALLAARAAWLLMWRGPRPAQVTGPGGSSPELPPVG